MKKLGTLQYLFKFFVDTISVCMYVGDALCGITLPEKPYYGVS